MATFNDDLLSVDDLDNNENDNEGDDHVDESSSDNEESREVKKILKTSKKRSRQGQQEDQHVKDRIEAICENEYFRRKFIFTNELSYSQISFFLQIWS